MPNCTPSTASPSKPDRHHPAGPAAAQELLTDALIDEWARAYCCVQQDPDPLHATTHPQWWAIERFLVFSADGRLEDCWRAVLAVLRMTSDPEVLGVLTAGPLEDLIAQADTAFADRLAWEGWTNPRFCRLLEGAWECGSPEVWQLIDSARSQAVARHAAGAWVLAGTSRRMQ